MDGTRAIVARAPGLLHAVVSGIVSFTNDPNFRLRGASTRSTIATPVRSPLQIDVLVLYSTATFGAGEETQLLTDIVAGFSTANGATANSGIDLKFNLVRVDQVSAELHPSGAWCTCRFGGRACCCSSVADRFLLEERAQQLVAHASAWQD